MTPAKRLPYPGLRAFTRDESDLFFGRDGCINAMVDRFAATRFLAVLGPSGGGKSSLVRTGFEDALTLGIHPWAGVQWKVADMHPGGQPIRNLAEALLSVGPLHVVEETDIQFLSDFLRRGPRAVVEWAEGGNIEPGWNLLILVDQFEELFRYGDYAQREEAEAFVALLIESAAGRNAPIHVVLTMRSEYLGACALIAGLADCINAGLYLTPRMGREECREAIEGPANVIGFKVEPALVNRLLNDLASFAPWESGERIDQAERLSRQADQLPVMQHVLNRLWVRASAEGSSGPILRLADYDRIGGLSGALDAHGAEVMAALGADRATAIEILFRALVTGPSVALAVRRPTTLGELVELTGSREGVIAIVDAFRAHGCNFLRTSQPSLADDRVIVDISHESLIRQWTPLREWLEQEAKSAAAWQRLLAAEHHYREHEGGLLSGTDLASLETFWESAKPTAVWAARHGGRFEEASAFLAASREAEAKKVRAEQQQQLRARNRLWASIVGLAVALAIFIGLAWKEMNEHQSALQAKNKALAAEAEAVKQRTAAVTDANRTASVLTDVSETLNSERYKDLVGFGELRSELMQKLLPYQKDLSRQHEDAVQPLAVVRDSYRRASALESVGDAKDAKEEYAKAYEDGKTLLEKLGGKRPGQDLEATFLEDGATYAWLLLDIGETEKGAAVIGALQHLVGGFPPIDTNARLLVDRARLEDLEGRYYWELKLPDQDLAHTQTDLTLSEKAYALPKPDLRTIEHLFWARHNYSLQLKGGDKERLETRACQVSEQLMSLAPLDSGAIRARIQCLSDESDRASDKGDFKTARAKLVTAHDILDQVLKLSPKEQSVLLSLAEIENSLGDLEYKELQQGSDASADTNTPAQVARSKHKTAAASLLVKAIKGRTVMQSELRSLYDNAKNTTFARGDELQFYTDIYDAMGQTLDAFPKAPAYLYIAADSSSNIGRILSDDPSRAKTAQDYTTKAIGWFERRGVAADLKSYSEDYATYCGAFANRAEAGAAFGRLDLVLADVNRFRSVCSPILERYPWDFYLRMGWLRIEGTAGKMLFDLHRYTESEKHLEVASKWGIRESTRVLAQIYAQGLGLSEKDPTRAQELEKLAARQETVKLNVPCDFRGTKAPFYIYAREWPAEYTRQFPGVNDQAKWLKEARNGIIPPKVVEAFERLQRFASDNDGFPHAVDEALSLEGTDSDAVDFAQRLFDGDRNATTLEIWRTAGKERYDYLVKKDRRSDANAVDNQLSEAADALLKQTKNDDSYRAAWKVFFAFGGHRSSTNVREARAASVRSAQLAELLPLDNPGDLARRMESYEQLGDADAGGDPQSAHDWYAKLLDAARARFSLKADAGGLKLLRIASTDLASILVKLKRPSDAEAVFKSLAAATDTLIGRSQSPDAIIEAFTVYARLVESERVLGNFAASQIDLSQERKLAPMIAAGTPDGELVRYKAFETLGDSLRVSGVPAEARESYAESAAALARYIVFLTASPARKADADDDELYEHYGSLSWILDEAGEFARAIEAAQSGLKLKPDAAYIEANLAHALLLSGKQQEAVSHYMKIRKSKVGSRGLLEATTEDFEILKQLGFADPEMDSILERMAQE